MFPKLCSKPFLHTHGIITMLGKAIRINSILQTEWDRPPHGQIADKWQSWAFDSSRLTLDHSYYPLCWPAFERCPLIPPAAQRAARWPGSKHIALAAVAYHHFLTRVIAFKTKLRHEQSSKDWILQTPICETTAHPLRFIFSLKKEQRVGLEAAFGWALCVDNLNSLINLKFRKKPPNELIYDSRWRPF